MILPPAPPNNGLVFTASEFIQCPNTLLEPLLPRYPELLSGLHDISQDGTTEEDHVLPAWGILDTNLEFLFRSSQYECKNEGGT